MSSADEFAGALRRAGIVLPVVACGTHVGSVVDGDGNEVCVIDVNAELDDHRVRDRVALVVHAINDCSGTWAVQP